MKGQKKKKKKRGIRVGCKHLRLPNGKKRRHTMRAFHDQTHTWATGGWEVRVGGLGGESGAVGGELPVVKSEELLWQRN